MISFDLTRAEVLLSLVAFYGLGMWLPSWRLRRRTGKSAMVVHQAANPFQQMMAVAMASYTLGLFVWGVLCAVLEPAVLGVWPSPLAVRAGGWAAMLAGFGVVVVAQAQMGASWRIGIDRERTALVTHGLFSVIRNPIFTGMQLMLLGVVFLTPSAWTVMGAAFGVFIFGMQARLEEQHLLNLHGHAYTQYAERAGRFVPALGRLRS